MRVNWQRIIVNALAAYGATYAGYFVDKRKDGSRRIKLYALWGKNELDDVWNNVEAAGKEVHTLVADALTAAGFNVTRSETLLYKSAPRGVVMKSRTTFIVVE